MGCYVFNTDWSARSDIVTCDVWFESNMAFAGDYPPNKWKHSRLFGKLEKSDNLFIYHSKRDKKLHNKKGFVGIAEVDEEWDEKCYEGEERILYREEIYEYRIKVKWIVDWRESPKDAKDIGLFTTPGTYAKIDEKKYPIQDLLADLYRNKG